MLAIKEAGQPNVGIVMDFGHSLLAGETPAEALQLVHRRGRLVSVELNDNRRGWDDDLPVAAVVLGTRPVPMRLLGPRTFAPTGDPAFLLEHFGLTAEGIARSTLEVLGLDHA
ncbi:hypothetical protein [Nonomuraea sp. NPDC050643]|uniref:hypothetical protein n=1 Tax=Nonomuraea sp. NPDC050643 TaxID=3155660 RepID=UPI0033F0D65D